jgi:hypothetical protein
MKGSPLDTGTILKRDEGERQKKARQLEKGDAGKERGISRRQEE